MLFEEIKAKKLHTFNERNEPTHPRSLMASKQDKLKEIHIKIVIPTLSTPKSKKES